MYINSNHEKAIASLKERNLVDALKLINLAFEESQNHPDLLADRGVIYIHLKEKEKAIADFNLAIELQPEYSYRYSSRAYARDFFGDIDGAIEDYEKAVLLDPEDAIAYNNLGLLLEKKGNLKKAKNNFERADKLLKIEGRFHEIISDIESGKFENESDLLNDSQRTTIPPSELRRKEENTISIMKNIFTSKESFSEFLQFIKKGFRLK
jgi:tetratricopeptide (TPR) repeat protein